MRRVGAHEVVFSNRTLVQAVVEIQGTQVVNYYEFRDELPMTEWLGGTITLKYSESGELQAWWNNKQLKEDLFIL